MDDLIGRWAAIEAFANVAFMHIEADKLGVHESMDGNWFNADEAVEALKQLPSPQIHCKDCKYYQRLSESCRSLRLKTGDEWYCADAERKVTE